MARSQETYSKKKREKKRLKKRQDKQQKKEERRNNAEGGGLDNMIAYVDENGMITDTPPDPAKKQKIDVDSIEIGIPKKTEVDGPVNFLGKVAYFNDSKGYGFIRENNSQEKYFVHVNGLLEQVRENDKVSFELERGVKGMNAVRVKKV